MRQPISVTIVNEYCQENIPHFTRISSLTQFSHGQSNPTYLIVDEQDHRFVLRKRPSGPHLASAHAIDREFKVMKALFNKIPVPRVYSLCDDESLLNGSFYVMDYVPGKIHMDPRLVEYSPLERRKIYFNGIRTLADLHSISPFTSPLLAEHARVSQEVDLIGSLKFYSRQAKTLSRIVRSQQAAHSQVPVFKGLDRFMIFVEEQCRTLPNTDRLVIMHGDYKLDNLIFNDNLEIKAILDWELSTGGHAAADLVNYCFVHIWHQTALQDSLSIQDPMIPLLNQDGIPNLLELFDKYCEYAGLPENHWKESMPFFMSFGLFKMGVIFQGVAMRALQGRASSERAQQVAQLALPAFEKAMMAAGLSSKL